MTTAREAVSEARQAWAAAMLAGDLPTLIGMYSDEVVVMPSDESAVAGRVVHRFDGDARQVVATGIGRVDERDEAFRFACFQREIAVDAVVPDVFVLGLSDISPAIPASVSSRRVFKISQPEGRKLARGRGFRVAPHSWQTA